jgi:hypothetical protein
MEKCLKKNNLFPKQAAASLILAAERGTAILAPPWVKAT